MTDIDLTIPSFLLRTRGVETMLPIGEAAQVVLAAVKDKRKKADKLPVPPPRMEPDPKPTRKPKVAKPKAKTKPAPNVARAASPPTVPDQPRTKTQLVAELLTRPEGCTTADVLAATGWTKVGMPGIAKRMGIELVKERDGDRPARYYAA